MTNPDNVGGLLPCPFCGTVDKLYLTDYEHDVIGEYWMAGCRNHDCHSDSCCVDKPTRDEAIAAWNTRAYGELCRAAPAGVFAGMKFTEVRIPQGYALDVVQAGVLAIVPQAAPAGGDVPDAGSAEWDGRSMDREAKAAPAGGGDVKCSCVHSDIADGAIELLDSVIDQIDSNDYQGGISLALYNDITGFLGNPKDSAPAGSGEVEGLADELEHMAETDYNTGCCNSDYPIAAASRLMRTAAAILRKLQQGAE